jgi:hypothetical protein
MFFGRRRPTVGRRPLEAEFIRRTSRPSAEGPAPIEIGPSRRCASSVGLRRRRECFSVGAGRPSAEGPWRPNSFGAQADRRPKALRRLKSASKALARRASASADAGNVFRSAQADRRPKAFAPIEIGPSRRCASSVGLRRRRECFSVGAGRPSAEGPRRPNSFGAQADRRPKALRRLKSASKALARRASASADAGNVFRSAQADRRPKAPGGRIHSAHKPTAGRRPSRRLKSALLGAPRPASAPADAGNVFRSAQADHRPKASRGRIHSACRPAMPSWAARRRYPSATSRQARSIHGAITVSASRKGTCWRRRA